MTANESKSYPGYLNKLVDEYNNIYHCSIGKKSIYADYSALTEETELSHKATKFKAGDSVRITKCKKYLSKGYINNWSGKIFVINSVSKTDPWTCKTNLKEETKIGSFYEKELLFSKL